MVTLESLKGIPQVLEIVAVIVLVILFLCLLTFIIVTFLRALGIGRATSPEQEEIKEEETKE